MTENYSLHFQVFISLVVRSLSKKIPKKDGDRITPAI